MLVQVASPNLAPLPADVRKWPDAVSEVQSMSELLHRKEESVDVLATRLLLWDNLMSADRHTDTDTLLQQMHDLLSPHGVWYMTDLLPAESPAHWAYTYFAGAWEWVRQRTLDLHVLYQRLQAVGFKSEVKRRVWYQPVALGTALEIAQQRPCLLARLPDEAYRQGIEQLQQAVTQHGVEHVIGSEASLIEVWVQKQ